MVLGLLTIAGIPTTIGIAEGISRRDEGNNPESSSTEEEQMRKFNLECYCDNTKGKASTVNGGRIVLRDEKMFIEPRSSTPKAHLLEGFYIAYPDPDRPKPPPLGLVSTISNDPPMLNWIYVHKDTREVKYGNRTQSKAHIVGSWGWEAGEEGGAGGVTLEGEEGAVAVETANGWEVRWEDDNGKSGVNEKNVLRISLERKMLEPKDDEKPKPAVTSNSQKEVRTDTKLELSKSRFEGTQKMTGPQQPSKVFKSTAGKGHAMKKNEPKLEVSSTTTHRPTEDG